MQAVGKDLTKRANRNRVEAAEADKMARHGSRNQMSSNEMVLHRVAIRDAAGAAEGRQIRMLPMAVLKTGGETGIAVALQTTGAGTGIAVAPQTTGAGTAAARETTVAAPRMPVIDGGDVSHSRDPTAVEESGHLTEAVTADRPATRVGGTRLMRAETVAVHHANDLVARIEETSPAMTADGDRTRVSAARNHAAIRLRETSNVNDESSRTVTNGIPSLVSGHSHSATAARAFWSWTSTTVAGWSSRTTMPSAERFETYSRITG